MDKIKQAIAQLAGTHGQDSVRIDVCTVTSVNENARTCEAATISGKASTNIIDIQLMAEVDDGLLLLPTVGSTIIVCYSTRNVPFVLLFSQVDKVLFIVGDTEVQMVDGTVTISQDKMQIVLTGGKISISNDSKNLFDILQDILNHILAITVPTSGGNSGTPINASDFTQDLTHLGQLMQ